MTPYSFQRSKGKGGRPSSHCQDRGLGLLSFSGNGRKALAFSRRLPKACGAAQDYRKISHGVYNIKDHVIWITR